MEEIKKYEVRFTSGARIFYYQVCNYFYNRLSSDSAERKSDELYTMGLLLETFPERGAIERDLIHLNRKHRFILYRYTSRRFIKVIYYIDGEKQMFLLLISFQQIWIIKRLPNALMTSYENRDSTITIEVTY